MRREQSKSDHRQVDSIERYLQEIGEFTPLAPAEEIELTRGARKGESSALDKLVKANLRFVILVAKRYQGRGVPLEDLISEGNLGLLKAAQRYDETRGFKFISHAIWLIRQSILQALAEQTHMYVCP
jgi:RNA polymerase primary sigma factor